MHFNDYVILNNNVFVRGYFCGETPLVYIRDTILYSILFCLKNIKFLHVSFSDIYILFVDQLSSLLVFFIIFSIGNWSAWTNNYTKKPESYFSKMDTQGTHKYPHLKRKKCWLVVIKMQMYCARRGRPGTLKPERFKTSFTIPFSN